MKAVLSAVRSYLAGDQTLVGWLSTYGGAPAIFTSDHIPSDVTPPYLVITTIASIDVSTKTDVVFEHIIGVEAWSNKGFSSEEVERISDRVFELMLSPTLSISGWTVLGSAPEPADEVSAGGGWSGRVVRTMLTLLKD